MSRLTDEERDIFENAIYLLILLTVLDRDLKVANAALEV